MCWLASWQRSPPRLHGKRRCGWPLLLVCRPLYQTKCEEEWGNLVAWSVVEEWWSVDDSAYNPWSNVSRRRSQRFGTYFSFLHCPFTLKYQTRPDQRLRHWTNNILYYPF